MSVLIRKKLIEVALPLEAINVASAREKSIRHGHPSTLHLWWARRPLAAARAVIFAQMVDDPSGYVDVLRSDNMLKRRAEKILKDRKKVWEQATEYARQLRDEGKSAGPEPTLDDILAELERQRLFKIIEQLVLWENTAKEDVLNQAREEIWASWRRACAENIAHPQAAKLFNRTKLPAFHDPFAGGGALPLEAQRLGLESYASDLNPVAVLINKAMIEIPPKFAGQQPVNPESRKGQLGTKTWQRAQGLAEDVRCYGQWMRDEAEMRIGHLYPKIEITAAMASERSELKPLVGQKPTVIAWIWARTVKSPNPAFRDVDVPLVSTFMLSTKPGKETSVVPVIEGHEYRFTVQVGVPLDLDAAKSGTKLNRANFRCIMSGTPIAGDYIKSESKAGRMGTRLMAIVAEGQRGRLYLAPTAEHSALAASAAPEWKPEVSISGSTQYIGIKPYGIERFDQLFTNRQLVALTTFSNLAAEAKERILIDARAAGFDDDGVPLCEGGSGAAAYSEAVATFLGCAISRMVNYSSTLCVWSSHAKDELAKQVFLRQALQMTWDFAETNPFSSAGGTLDTNILYLKKAIDGLPARVGGNASQANATQIDVKQRVISTDPPYFDNVPYADLSDFFYVWLRRSLQSVFPSLFATVAVPKVEELVAFAYRHVEGKVGAQAFFLNGMTQAMHRLAEGAHCAFPVTIYYAFRQSESDEDAGTASTGWDTFLEAVIQSGFGISGTWPMRTEYTGNLKTQRNALASSIVLVCRKRSADAPTATRRELVVALQRELPEAVRHLQAGNIAPVDLAQAAIGPGMAVFTRYAKVLDAQGDTLSVREALALINETLDTALAEQEGDFDADSRWALAWFEQNGFSEGEYGVAETLSKAKNTSVNGLVDGGILSSSRSKVRLLKPEELPADWDPSADARLTHWETVHHLIRALTSGGENAAAELVKKLGAKAETARELAYRLYTLCERKKRANEALAYNALVQSWPEILRQSQSEAEPSVPTQTELL